MTPRTVTAMLPAATTVREFLASAKAAPFSRVPIFGESEDDADRYVLQREVLRHAAEGDLDRPLAELARVGSGSRDSGRSRRRSRGRAPLRIPLRGTGIPKRGLGSPW
jgi:CBS domain containing-hemolysin-like protein